MPVWEFSSLSSGLHHDDQDRLIVDIYRFPGTLALVKPVEIVSPVHAKSRARGTFPLLNRNSFDHNMLCTDFAAKSLASRLELLDDLFHVSSFTFPEPVTAVVHL